MPGGCICQPLLRYIYANSTCCTTCLAIAIWLEPDELRFLDACRISQSLLSLSLRNSLSNCIPVSSSMLVIRNIPAAIDLLSCDILIIIIIIINWYYYSSAFDMLFCWRLKWNKAGLVILKSLNVDNSCLLQCHGYTGLRRLWCFLISLWQTGTQYSVAPHSAESMYMYVRAMYPVQDTPTILHWSTAWISASAAVLTWVRSFFFYLCWGLWLGPKQVTIQTQREACARLLHMYTQCKLSSRPTVNRHPLCSGNTFCLSFLLTDSIEHPFFCPKPQRQNPSQIVISWLAGPLDPDEKFTNFRRMYNHC